MYLASQTRVSSITNEATYGDAAAVNAMVVAKSNGRVPCYAIRGKRTRVKWVSVGSSAVISRGVAADFLRRVGVDINEAEAA